VKYIHKMEARRTKNKSTEERESMKSLKNANFEAELLSDDDGGGDHDLVSNHRNEMEIEKKTNKQQSGRRGNTRVEDSAAWILENNSEPIDFLNPSVVKDMVTKTFFNEGLLKIIQRCR
jgi:hypothetical protein